MPNESNELILLIGRTKSRGEGVEKMSDEKRVSPFGIAWRAINGYMALAKKTKDWEAMEDVQELMAMMAAFSDKQSSSAAKRWSNAPHESTAPMHRIDAPHECSVPMPKEGMNEGKKDGLKEEKNGNPPSPLQAPPGFVEPGDRFAGQMKNSLAKYGDMWQEAYIAKKKAKPVWVPGMLKFAEQLTFYTDDQVKAGFKSFFRHEGKYVKNHDFAYFCQNALRFINDGLNPDDEIDIRATSQYFKDQEAKLQAIGKSHE